MTYFRRFFAMLTPTPLAGIAAFLTALAVGYLLWAELEPAQRHTVAVGPPWTDEEWYSHQVNFSPDGRSLVFHYRFTPLGEEAALRPHRAAVHLYGLSTNQQLVVSEKFDSPITFAPDGKQMAGFSGDTVYVWDRETGTEQNRYSLKKTTRKQVLEPWIAFMPQGLVLWSEWSLDENDKVEKHIIALAANKPWNGNETEFDRMHNEQGARPLHSIVSSDGRRSLSFGKTGLLVSDASGKPPKSIAISDRFQMTGRASISPDGKTLLIQGRSWRPVQQAHAWLTWVYGEGKDPVPADGVLFVDVDSGAEIVFVESSGDFGVTPDGKTFIRMERSDSNPGVTLTIYDWPLGKPWWRIVAGALLVFVALVLVSKAWRRLRGTPKPSDEGLPRAKPPWETEETAAEPRADSSNHAD